VSAQRYFEVTEWKALGEKGAKIKAGENKEIFALNPG
jgi:hypothetical protein